MSKISYSIRSVFSKVARKIKEFSSTSALVNYKYSGKKDFHELAKLVHTMARTGIGTESCLELGCLPVLVHFYTPIPDIKDLEKREIWSKKRSLAGIDFRPEAQLKFLAELGKEFGHECSWSISSTSNPIEFSLSNNSFSFGCAAALHSIIRKYKPRRVVEIGSGASSMVISKALSLNTGVKSEYIIIDPYPSDLIRKGLPGVTQLIDQRVELLETDLFEKLGENDILFIDSGHTVRTGGDVNFLFLDVLPLLSPGTLIHFHDIGMPYEYPHTYFTNPSFRVFWTEDYLLQAFLAFNDKFEILLAMTYIQAEHMDKFCEAFPNFDLTKNLARSGSFWIKRK
jgi:hypothetical protein